MTRRLLMIVTAAAMLLGIVGTAQAQSRASVSIYNNSNRSLVFHLQAQGSTGWDRYRIAPRSTRRFTANAGYVAFFRVRIVTTGRGARTYTLRPSRTYQLQWDQRIGMWNVFTRSHRSGTRAFVRIYNNSNRSLVFLLKTAEGGRFDTHRIGPRQWRTYYALSGYTRFFTVQINTTGRGSRRYTLVQGRRYQFKWDGRIGLWNVFTIR